MLGQKGKFLKKRLDRIVFKFRKSLIVKIQKLGTAQDTPWQTTVV